MKLGNSKFVIQEGNGLGNLMPGNDANVIFGNSIEGRSKLSPALFLLPLKLGSRTFSLIFTFFLSFFLSFFFFFFPFLDDVSGSNRYSSISFFEIEPVSVLSISAKIIAISTGVRFSFSSSFSFSLVLLLDEDDDDDGNILSENNCLSKTVLLVILFASKKRVRR